MMNDDDCNRGYDAYWDDCDIPLEPSEQFMYGWNKAKAEDYGLKKGVSNDQN